MRLLPNEVHNPSSLDSLPQPALPVQFQVRTARSSSNACNGTYCYRTFSELGVDDGEFSRLLGANGHTVDASRIKRYEVETITLNDIFAASDMPARIDFLSLDTEDSEVDILAGLDLDRYTFGAMAIEHNYNPTALANLRRILLPKGYKQVLDHLSGFDAWFVHSSSPNQFNGD